VARGAPRPDLSTADTFRQVLPDARSAALSHGGASGSYFAGLIEQLGIAETIRAKATVIPAGFTAEKLVSGEADLAIQQVSELMVVDGIDIVGPFPAEVQATMRFAAATAAGSPARWRHSKIVGPNTRHDGKGDEDVRTGEPDQPME